MARIASVGRVARIQQDNLVDVHNFIKHGEFACSRMKWSSGYDLDGSAGLACSSKSA